MKEYSCTNLQTVQDLLFTYHNLQHPDTPPPVSTPHPPFLHIHTHTHTRAHTHSLTHSLTHPFSLSLPPSLPPKTKLSLSTQSTNYFDLCNLSSWPGSTGWLINRILTSTPATFVVFVMEVARLGTARARQWGGGGGGEG